MNSQNQRESQYRMECPCIVYGRKRPGVGASHLCSIVPELRQFDSIGMPRVAIGPVTK